MKLTIYSKLMIVSLFAVVCMIEIDIHSDRWNSFIDGILFMSEENYETEHLHILKLITAIVVPILSILFLLIPNKWMNLAIIILMVTFNLMILPGNYILDPGMNF